LGWSKRTKDGHLVPKSSEVNEVLQRVKKSYCFAEGMEVQAKSSE
jgi:hypothetical protein